MLPLDNRLVVPLGARDLDAPCMRHFHDPKRRVGKAIAQGLGVPGKTAWDIYLFYAPGQVWTEEPPLPDRWAHQLGDRWADPAHYRRGADLIRELSEAMEELQ